MKLFVDDRFALQSIQKLPTMYKELYMVSFANWKMQEMWYASRREISVLQVGDCQKEDMNAMLQKLLFSFLSMRQLKTHSRTISIKLKKHWFNDKFMGFAMYCGLPFRLPKLSRARHSAFSLCLGFEIKTKLVSEQASLDRPTLEDIIYLEVSNAVSSDRQDCFVFLQFDKTKVYFKGKGKEPFSINSPNDYCRFEVSLNSRISANWGNRPLYADDIEVMRLKWKSQLMKQDS
ncbi:hypothetical protein KY290_007822 [Solanum tuberosum]|uniref:C-JID domain-containing protein n=1 Tax=Solanum tuberosum TaxID=4113 RepID=A0ABQ7W6N0_SOLTU|nr:hypothetical protein KY290_007822 [Solanum tuberosum]